MSARLELKEGWATVALLLAVLLCIAWSIQAADWTVGLSILQPAVLAGGVAGIVLAKSRAPNRMAHLLALLAGFTWAAYLTSRVVAATSGLSAEEAVLALDRQIRTWLSILFSGETTPGTDMFLLLLTFLMWLVAYVSAWTIFRWQKVWWAVILCGVALMPNVTYSPDNLTAYVVVFVLFSLLLVVRTSLAFYQQEWRLARVGYSQDLVFAFLRAGLIITLVAILMAWVAPVVLASRSAQEVWSKMGEPWRRLQDQSSRLFHNLNYRNQPAYISFGRSMRFGGPVELSDTPIIDVRAATGRYWRVMAFHEYASNGWNNTDVDTILIDENERGLSSPSFALREEITQTVTLQQNLGPDGMIAAAAQPLRSGLPLTAVVAYITREGTWSESTDALGLPLMPGDASVLYSRARLRAGDSYGVVSSLSKADQQSLRDAGTAYPSWVVPRYLQLPESLPERVSLLAAEVTAGQATPYDKAVAIEAYLRGIPYNEQIAGPDPDQDGVDYFLFEAKQGYCDYYASAMVVMLRSVGVPARFVRGFSQGVKEEGVFHVLERDGHAWPEVFFPAYGWVEFEPTAGEPVLSRPGSDDALVKGSNSEQPLNGPQDRGPDDLFEGRQPQPLSMPESESLLQRLGWLGILALVLLVVALFLAVLWIVRRRRRIEDLPIPERIYDDLTTWAVRLLRVHPLLHQTPNEYGAAVIEILPAGRQPVEQIVDAYVGHRFGGRSTETGQIEAAWKATRSAMWHRWVQRRGERLASTLRWALFAAPAQRDKGRGTGAGETR